MSYKNYGMTLVKRKKKRYVYGKRKTIKNNGGSPSVKATLENRYKDLEKKSENVMDEIAQLKLRNSHTIFETFTDTEKELYDVY